MWVCSKPCSLLANRTKIMNILVKSSNLTLSEDMVQCCLLSFLPYMVANKRPVNKQMYST